MSADVIFYYTALALGFLTFCYGEEFLIIFIIRREIMDKKLRKNFDKTFTNPTLTLSLVTGSLSILFLALHLIFK